jgi:Flavin containing amine oxidoreductase
MRITRRDFLSASAGIAATPLFAGRTAAAPPARDADIVVIGAGVAGIAAARRVLAANRKVIVLEAASQIGGRCQTDSSTFEVPFDRGARWAHNPETNPMIRLARTAGLELMPAPAGEKIRIGRRNARPGETEEFLAALVRANRAIDDAARRSDVSCASVLPKELGDWAGTAEFVLGASFTGKDLKDISVVDKTRAQDRTDAIACRQGLGTLIARLGAQLPVALSTPTACPGATATSSWTRLPARSLRAPPSSRCRSTCSHPASSGSIPIFQSASAMPSPSSASAAMIGLRWSCRAIRLGLRATIS